MKKIFCLLLVLLTFTVKSQTNILGVPQNSATTQSKIDLAKKNIDQAYQSYIDGNIEKTKYYVDQSQKNGYKSGDFYFLLGTYMYHTEEFKAAKRYWKIAFKEGGCWECKEYLEKLEKKESLDNPLKQKAQMYLNELNK